LGDYAGTYVAGAGSAGQIAVQQGMLQLHYGATVTISLRPIVRDDFASPGSPGTGYLFQRDHDGHVAGLVVRHQGQDLLLVKLPVYRSIKA